MGYRYLEHLTWADAAFEAEGASLEELFAAAADATLGVMVTDPSRLSPVEARAIRLEAQEHDLPRAADKLLHGLLEKIVFFKDAEQLLLRPAWVQILSSTGGHVLEAELRGEAIDPEKHELLTDVKAVTYHRFRVERVGGAWRATVVLDV